MRLGAMLLLLSIAPTGCRPATPATGRTPSVRTWQRAWNRELAREFRALADDLEAGKVTTAAEMKRRMSAAALDGLDRHSAPTADAVTLRSQPDGVFSPPAAAAVLRDLARQHERAAP